MKHLKWSALALASVAIVACTKEDEMDQEPSMNTGSMMVSNQTLSQNTIVVPSIDMDTKGFVVVHRDNGMGAPVVPGIIGEAVAVNAGTNTNVEIPLTDVELTDGENLWIMLHFDTGTEGVYEFDGANGFDGPVTDADGNIVMQSIEISSAAITVMNQPVVNNTITIPNVKAAADGWLVIHNDNGSGGIVLPGIIGKTLVSKGDNANVVVQLDSNETYTSGQLLFPMLHLDNGTIGEYEFDGAGQFDGPEIFSNDAFPGNVIFTSFTVQ